MDRHIFINFLKAMPPFYSCITDKLLGEIKSHKEIRSALLKEFDVYLDLRDDKATWFKYLSSMPLDSKNAQGQYRILKYFKTFPHSKIEKSTLEEVLKIKNDLFLVQFLLLLPKNLDPRVQYCIGACLQKNQSVKEALFKELSNEMKKYFTSCVNLYSKYRDDMPVPKPLLKKSEAPKLLPAPKNKNEAQHLKFFIKRSHLENSRTKKRGSSSRIPFSQESDDLWNYLCQQSSSHEYKACPKVYSRFSDILAYDHQGNLITVIDNESEVQIHANLIRLERDLFILAQYPSNQMTGQFLRCALQNKTHLIFDLTQNKDIAGLHKYYQSGEYDGMRVQARSAENKLSCGFVISEMECFDSKDLKIDSCIFYHLRFDGWKDHETLPIKKIKLLLEDAEKWIEKKGGRTPPIIHCNAGIGRSAIFVGALHIRKQIKSKKIQNTQEALKCVADTIWSLRVQRGPDCVQTYAQVNMLVQIALHELDHLKEGDAP